MNKEELENRVKELESFISEAASFISSASLAVDILADKKPGRNIIDIHSTNIEFYKKIKDQIENWDIKLFTFGNYEDGKFVFGKK